MLLCMPCHSDVDEVLEWRLEPDVGVEEMQFPFRTLFCSNIELTLLIAVNLCQEEM